MDESILDIANKAAKLTEVAYMEMVKQGTTPRTGFSILINEGSTIRRDIDVAPGYNIGDPETIVSPNLLISETTFIIVTHQSMPVGIMNFLLIIFTMYFTTIKIETVEKTIKQFLRSPETT